MFNLKIVLKAAMEDEGIDGNNESKVGHHLYFSQGDITDASYFDPFMHVYMFDIGLVSYCYSHFKLCINCMTRSLMENSNTVLLDVQLSTKSLVQFSRDVQCQSVQVSYLLPLTKANAQ
jgi:hypothetical protein